MALPRQHEASPMLAEHYGISPQSSESQTARSNSRYHALDNLRTFLTVLVILHHTALAYGGAGGWDIHSRCFPPLSATLVIFGAINQSFFMALFFFLSGHFTQIQGCKKSKSAVFCSRLLRILLPSAVYTLLFEPTLQAIVWGADTSAYDGTFNTVWAVYLDYWKNVRGLRGPVWYLGLVMVFDTIAILSHSRNEDSFSIRIFRQDRHFWASIVWIMSILASFAIRIVFPVGEIWVPLNLQLAYLPQYISAYSAGHLSVVFDDPFILMPFRYALRNSIRRVLRWLAFSLFTLGVMHVIERFALGLDDEQMMELGRGGFNLPALLYAIWNEVGFATIGFALLAAFLEHADYPWTLFGGGLWLPRYSYGAYLLHAPVSVVVEIAVEALMGCSKSFYGTNIWALLGPVLMTVGVGMANVIGSWTASIVVHLVPGIGKVI